MVDRGLQAQRTALAWRRTALAALANAAIVLKVALQHRWRALIVFGLLMLIGALLVAWYGHRRQRQLSDCPQAGQAPQRAMLALALFNGLCCAVGAMVILAG